MRSFFILLLMLIAGINQAQARTVSCSMSEYPKAGGEKIFSLKKTEVTFENHNDIRLEGNVFRLAVFADGDLASLRLEDKAKARYKDDFFMVVITNLDPKKESQGPSLALNTDNPNAEEVTAQCWIENSTSAN